jgi:sulfur carrier protein
MSKLKHFLLNGQEYSTECDLTILELIQYFNYNTSLLVLEYNNLICNKKSWSNTFIKTNDKIEIVTIVGGG